MTVLVTKPEFNLRSKLTELDGVVPVEKMPSGSIIQTAFYHTTSTATSNSSSSYNSIGLWVDITPRIVGSMLEVSACIPNYSNNTDGGNWTNSFYCALYATLPWQTTETRISTFEHPGPRYSDEFVQVVSPVFYQPALRAGTYMFNWRVKMTLGSDTHYFGRNVDSSTSQMNTTVREIKQ